MSIYIISCFSVDNNNGEKTYAGMSEIHGSCDVMLKTNAEYFHGLALHAKIPVYLQALLLLLRWLSLHLPTGAYKARTSHARFRCKHHSRWEASVQTFCLLMLPFYVRLTHTQKHTHTNKHKSSRVYRY